MIRENFPDGTPFESVMGYSRAVRTGNMVFVSGTVGWRVDGSFDAGDDVYTQAQNALANIEKALERAGASMSDVVRTRVYIVDATSWSEVARAHLEVFDTIRPASSLIVVDRLVGEGMLVEIEADAVIAGGG